MASNVKFPTARMILNLNVSKNLVVAHLDGNHAVESCAPSIVMIHIGATVIQKMNVKQHMEKQRRKRLFFGVVLLS